MSIEIETLDRTLHGDDEDKAVKLEHEAQLQANLGRIDRAIQLYREDLHFREEVQKRERRPVHKGGPLYSIGLLLLFLTEEEYKGKDLFGIKERLPSALNHILLAYIEDVLNTPFKREVDADIAAAALALKRFFGMEPTFLDEIRNRVFSWKRDGRWLKAYDPQVILNEVITSRGEPTTFARVLQEGKIPHFIPRQPIGFPQPWDRRVFIGANYLDQRAIVDVMEEIVAKLDFTPVVMARTIIPQGKTHHHSLMMLHTCKYAMIDVTGEAGQLMELERTFDYEIEPLVVIKKSYLEIGKLSEMVKTWRKIEPRPYDDSSFESIRRDLERLIKEYLEAGETEDAKDLARTYFESKFGSRWKKLTISGTNKGSTPQSGIYYVNFELEVEGKIPVAGSVPVNVRTKAVMEPSGGWWS